jgi:HK97 family phage major capsid protein
MANTKIRQGLEELIAKGKAALEKKAQGGNFDEKAFQEKLEKRLAEERQKMLSENRKGTFEMDKEDRDPSELVMAKSADAKVREFQKWNDDVLLTSVLLKKHPTQLKLFRKRFEEFRGVSELRKAMDTATASEGAEWIPTDFSSDLIDKVRLATKVPALFPEIQMPTPTFKLPAVASDGAVYLVNENTADTGQTKPTASTPGTRVVTLTAKKLGSANRYSQELVEDSIIPILDFIKNNMAIAWADALEDVVLNGDTTSTHQDADVTSALDHRKAWKGLRKLALGGATTTTSLTAVPTIAELRTMRAKMGRYGVDPSKLALICSAKGYLKLLSVAEIITVDKYGPGATILSGELAKLDGIPVIVSGKMRDDLGAAGVNDATTNAKGALLLVYLPAFIRGIRRRMTSWSRYEGEFDQTVLVTMMRADFQPLFDEASEPIATLGVNWAV